MSVEKETRRPGGYVQELLQRERAAKLNRTIQHSKELVSESQGVMARSRATLRNVKYTKLQREQDQSKPSLQ